MNADIAPPEATSPTRLRRRVLCFIGVPLALAALVASGLVFWPFMHHFNQVCVRCGMFREGTTWLFTPDGSKGFLTMHSAAEHTPLSTLVTERGIVGPHGHAWRYKGGATYFFGRHRSHGHNHAVRQSLVDAHAANVVRFVENVHEYVGEDKSRAWTRAILSPTPTRWPRLNDLLDVWASFPVEGFDSREEFLAWYRAHTDDLALFLHGRRASSGWKGASP